MSCNNRQTTAKGIRNLLTLRIASLHPVRPHVLVLFVNAFIGDLCRFAP